MSVTCTRWDCTEKRPCDRCAKTLAVANADAARAWLERTGHCHGCGQPAVVCLCTERRPCGCQHLHKMGGGIGVDLAEMFAEPSPATVGDDQGELFA